MSISLNTFTTGMTDYITKHNSNYSVIQSYINAMNADLEGLKGASNAGADLDFRLVTQNWIINGGFDYWQRGNSTRPDAWEIMNDSPGFSVVKSSSEIKLNSYSVRTIGTGQLTQNLTENLRLALDNTVSFYFGCYVKTNAEDQARIGIYNGLTTSYSSYHSGGNDWEFLKINYVATGSIPSEIRFILDENIGTVYWNSAVVIRGNPNAGPIYIANDKTIEELRVLSLYETGVESVRGVGFLNIGDREIEKKVNFLSPKRSVPSVSIISEIPTPYDVQVENVTRFGFTLLATELGGSSGSDGFELSEIEWIAEV